MMASLWQRCWLSPETLSRILPSPQAAGVWDAPQPPRTDHVASPVSHSSGLTLTSVS